MYLRYLIGVSFAVLISCSRPLNYAILESVPAEYYVLPDSCTITSLSLEEVQLIDKLLRSCVYEYNTQVSNRYQIPRLHNYKLQFVAYLDENNTKWLHINGFSGRDDSEKWKTRDTIIFDGGNSVISALINLTSEECKGVGINGES